MIATCGGVLLLVVGVARVREGTTGFCVITGFYAILAGVLLCGASLFMNDNGMPQVPIPEPHRHVECMQDCQAGSNDDE